jgi:NAD(P)-dependent dehydrogenase (short-subunit alcohol dehydrogenase family)
VLHYAGTWRSVLFDEMTVDQLDPVLDVHLRGGFFVTHAAWPIMKAKGYGRIVLCSSSTGVFGRRFGSNYSAAKAGLIGLGKTLALEGKDFGIKANCLMPIARSSVQKYQASFPAAMLDDYKVTGLSRPLPEEASSERLVPLPTYLASSACAVTGESFSGGGGRYARIFVGLTKGWMSEKDSFPTAEDIAAHLDEIEDRSSYSVPASIYEELRGLAEQIAERDGVELPAAQQA